MEPSNMTSSNPMRALAAVLLIVMFGSGYAISNRDGDANTGATATATAESFEYFPAQYVNQARDYEEHIQAF